MPNYTYDALISLCDEAIMSPSIFYKEGFIKSEEILEDGKTLRTEAIAKYILDNFEQFDKIGSISRKKTYKTAGHDGDISKSRDPKISERKLAKILFSLSFNSDYRYEEIGKLLDYEIPLKNSLKDKGVGTIDLLAINDDKRKAYILELKKEDSPESMLKCVLEGYTYSRIVDKKRLFDSFDIPEDYMLVPAVFVFKHKEQWNQIQELKAGKRPMLKDLIKQLSVETFFITSNNDGTYTVTNE